MVDDSPIVRSFIADEFGDPDIEIIEASTGTEAIALAREHEPDLITLDIEMPGFNGYEVCEDLKMDERTMRIPIVVVSSRTQVDEQLRALTAGALDYLGKPFPEGQLKAIVQGINSRYAENSERTVFCFDGSRAIRAMLRQLMLSQGFRVMLFDDEHEVRTHLDSHRSDLFLLGFGSDQKETLGLVRWIRGQARFDMVPIVALARSGERKDLQVAFNSGVNDYIQMPFFAEELVARVTNQLHLKGLESRLRREATMDSLTRLCNRREMLRLYHIERARVRRQEQPLGCLLIDIDLFKNINDTAGHVTGDEVLRWLGIVLRSNMRATDISARFGGDEFAIILPGAPLRLIQDTGERLRKALAAVEVKAPDGTVRFTASIGGTSWDPGELTENMSWDEFMAPADRALYQAKADGRNCTRVVSGTREE